MFGRKKDKAGKEEATDKSNLSFLGHLEELRWRLWRMAIGILIFVVVVFIFTDEIMEDLILVFKSKDFITYRLFGDLGALLGIGENFYAEDIQFKTISTGMTQQFGTHIFLAIVGGIICSFPYIAYQLWQFVKPGLREKEAKATRGVVFFTSLLFFVGVLFGYFLVTPLTVQFFGNYRIHDSVDNFTNINSYMSTIISTTFASGLFFLLPMVIYVLSKIGIVSAAFLRKTRKHAIVGLLVLSAIITPPDVISQVLVTIPLMGLYEISIRVAARIEKNRLKEA